MNVFEEQFLEIFLSTTKGVLTRLILFSDAVVLPKIAI